MRLVPKCAAKGTVSSDILGNVWSDMMRSVLYLLLPLSLLLATLLVWRGLPQAPQEPAYVLTLKGAEQLWPRGTGPPYW